MICGECVFIKSSKFHLIFSSYISLFPLLQSVLESIPTIIIFSCTWYVCISVTRSFQHFNLIFYDYCLIFIDWKRFCIYVKVFCPFLHGMYTVNMMISLFTDPKSVVVFNNACLSMYCFFIRPHILSIVRKKFPPQWYVLVSFIPLGSLIWVVVHNIFPNIIISFIYTCIGTLRFIYNNCDMYISSSFILFRYWNNCMGSDLGISPIFWKYSLKFFLVFLGEIPIGMYL